MQTLTPYYSLPECLILLWSLLLAAAWLGHTWRRGWRNLALRAALVLGAAALFPLIPSSPPVPDHGKPRQVIYRFDDHRHLELEGYYCEGALDYVDTRRGIRTTVVSQFYSLFLQPFIHADNDSGFIFIPLEDASAFMLSRDGGKTFGGADWVHGPPHLEEIQSITVVNRQAFITGKDGRLWMTSKPFGQAWGMEVVDPVYELPNLVHRDWPEYQHLPKTIPPINGYKGWTEMHCDPNLDGPELPSDGNSLYEWQHRVVKALGMTVALPVTLVVWALAKWAPMLLTLSGFPTGCIPLLAGLLSVAWLWGTGQCSWRIPAACITVLLAAVGLFLRIPSSPPEPTYGKLKQVVFRFDDHRYLELDGIGCEGAVDYVDTRRGIRTTVIRRAWRPSLASITHADNDGDYIFIPDDAFAIASFMVSKDGGKTFEKGYWLGDSPKIKAITVTNRQAFITGEDGRLTMTSRPVGLGWGIAAVDPENDLPYFYETYQTFPRFQHLPKTIPPVKGYKGWTEMHCDPNLKGPALPKPSDGNSLYDWQQRVWAALGSLLKKH